MGPHYLDGVQDRGGRRQEQELAAHVLEQLSHFPAPMRGVVVEHHYICVQIVLLCHLQEKVLDCQCVGSRRQPRE